MPSKKKKSQDAPQSAAFNDPPEEKAESAADDAFDQDPFDEDAVTEAFDSPPEQDDFSEVAAMTEENTEAFGVDEGLLEMKQQIEGFLMQGIAEGGLQTESAYEGANNIVGVGLGLGLPDQDPGAEGLDVEPGQQVLNVYVVESSSVDQVKSAMVDSMGISAASDDSVPINVIVSGEIDANSHRFKIRPAPGGVSVGHFKVTAGTLGCLATGLRAPRNRRVLMLSNNHVIANSNNARFGDCITQPGRYDGGRCNRDRIAILERFVPINFAGGANYVDAATGWCWHRLVRRELVYRTSRGLGFFRVSSRPTGCRVGMYVGKTGRTTQLRVGRITDCRATVRVNYGGGRSALFRDQIVIRGLSGAFSAGGDSGSLVWSWNSQRNPVGLLFAGGGGLTIANKIGYVLRFLDIRLLT